MKSFIFTRFNILKKTIFCVFLLGFYLNQASAAFLTVYQDLPTYQNYGSNTEIKTYSSSFDAASALGSLNFSADYTVVTAVVRFGLDGNNDTKIFISNTQSSDVRNYVGPFFDGTYNNYYRHAYYVDNDYYLLPKESVTLSLSGLQFTSESVPYEYADSTNSYDMTVYDGNGGDLFSRYYTYEHHDLADYYTNYKEMPDFSIDLFESANGNALSDLQNDGILDFDLIMDGTVWLGWAMLELEVIDNRTVQEPDGFALAALALAGLLIFRRKYVS